MHVSTNEINHDQYVYTKEAEVTACVVFGIPAPKSINTTNFHGLVKNCPALFLVDYGSSHNFVDISLVK